MDKSQDWFLLHGEENDFGTVLKFVRKIDTCDSAEDMVIQVGVSKKIQVKNKDNENEYIDIKQRKY